MMRGQFLSMLLAMTCLEAGCQQKQEDAIRNKKGEQAKRVEPKFNPKDIAEALRWCELQVASMQPSGNDIRDNENAQLLNNKLKEMNGIKVSWQIPVKRVTEEYIYFSDLQSGDVEMIIWVSPSETVPEDLLDSRLLLSTPELRQWAKRITPGQTITFDADLVAGGVRTPPYSYHQAISCHRFRIKLCNARVREK
jgi:hypothetical protein